MSDRPTQQQAGTIVAGRYRLLRALGEGAFGEVWLSQQLSDGQQVVVKILHAQWARVASVVERFRREALATTRVNHPSVCRIHEYAMTDDEVPFIVMEYLTGGTLKQELQRAGGAMTVGRVAELMAPVCEAVAAAHQVNIIHRDLKPENIMLTSRGGREEPIVLDFGIAKLLDATEKLTTTGSMLGTPAYMSPEQCQGKTDIGPAADVYALAIISFELLIGRPPFTSRTLAEMAMKHVLEPPAKLSAVPQSLTAVIDRSLAKDPKDRPSASLLARALREAGNSIPNARADVVEIPDDQKLNPSGGGGPASTPAKPDAGKRKTAPPSRQTDAHLAQTVISTSGADIEKRTQDLLKKTGRLPGKPSTGNSKPVDSKGGIPPLAIAFVVVALAIIGVLVGLLIRG